MENSQIIKKADIALSDLATAGRLSPEQTDRFIRKLLDQPTILQASRAVAMGAPEMKINKIGFGSRILRAGVQGTALSQSERSKPDLGQIVLNTSEVIAEVRIPYAVLEDNIERGNINAGAYQGAGGLHQTIVDMIAERASLDLEELALLGDTSSVDPFLSLQDGWLKLASANVVNVNAAFSKDAVKAAVKATPTPYLRNRAAMIHYISVGNETELRDQYASRQTALGDAQVQGNLPLYVFGSQVKGSAMMPPDSGLFTNPLNLIFGIQRQITIEYDKDITTREFIIVLTARVATQIEEIEAVTKYTNILPT